jgi:hypothetical protein
MEYNKNIEHSYDLSHAIAGDWFLGCSKCWLQMPFNAAAANECPVCLGRMNRYDVTQEDVMVIQ